VSSAKFIYQTSASEFTDALMTECKKHPAVHHPYLSRLANGQYPNHQLAVKDFARQYGFYSANFTKALIAVQSRLDDDLERQIIGDNLREEEGSPDSVSLEGLPHRELFRLFSRQVGVDNDPGESEGVCLTVKLWTRFFIEQCAAEPVEFAIGAIGLGTELIVPTIYLKLIQAVDRLEVADRSEARMFFSLHLGADDQHGAAFVRIATNHARSQESREALRFGAISSLNLRKCFYDTMDVRAMGAVDVIH